MKKVRKLFTTETKGIWLEDSEEGIFGYFDKTPFSKEMIFFNSQGERIEWMRKNKSDTIETSEVYRNDRDKVDLPLTEGRYVFTTHDIEYEADGTEHGCFGIKDSEGKVVVPEQYESIRGFYNGLCSVQSLENHLWGFIDRDGNLVIDFKYVEGSDFNQYGVAVGNYSLIDKGGNDIPGTALNYIGDVWWESRYYVIGFDTPEDEANGFCDKCDIYDTKNREYVAKRIREHVDVFCYYGEKDIILEAVKYLNGNNSVEVHSSTCFSVSENGSTTIYKYEA